MKITLLILTTISGVSSYFIKEETEFTGVAKVTQSSGSIMNVLTLSFLN